MKTTTNFLYVERTLSKDSGRHLENVHAVANNKTFYTTTIYSYITLSRVKPMVKLCSYYSSP